MPPPSPSRQRKPSLRSLAELLLCRRSVKTNLQLLFCSSLARHSLSIFPSSHLRLQPIDGGFLLGLFFCSEVNEHSAGSLHREGKSRQSPWGAMMDCSLRFSLSAGNRNHFFYFFLWAVGANVRVLHTFTWLRWFRYSTTDVALKVQDSGEATASAKSCGSHFLFGWCWAEQQALIGRGQFPDPLSSPLVADVTNYSNLIRETAISSEFKTRIWAFGSLISN